MKRKKIGLFVLLSVILFGYAGTVDYTEAVVYNMPQVIYDGIVEEHPDFSQTQIADYYVENQEELNLFYKFAMNE